MSKPTIWEKHKQEIFTEIWAEFSAQIASLEERVSALESDRRESIKEEIDQVQRQLDQLTAKRFRI